MAQPAKTCWVVTDGRAGIEAQASALAEAVAAQAPFEISVKKLAVGAPWNKLPRTLWGDPFSRLTADASSLTEPFPDLWIGCGRLSVPFSIAAKKRAPRTFVVQLQNPRAPLSAFDLVIAPEHDSVSGGNVISIVGSTMRKAPARAPQENVVAVMIGGPNRAFDFTAECVADLAGRLAALTQSGARLWVTTSRRTPKEAAGELERRLSGVAEIFWRHDASERSANPHQRMLAEASSFIVTEDSVNMSVEAAQTGAPVHIAELPRRKIGSTSKFDAFHQSLAARGASRPFDGVLAAWTYAPLDETMRAASEILRRMR